MAKRGKKVKLLDESASVKELPKQEDVDDDLERDGEVADNASGESPTKTKLNKIKEERDEESERFVE